MRTILLNFMLKVGEGVKIPQESRPRDDIMSRLKQSSALTHQESARSRALSLLPTIPKGFRPRPANP